MAVENGCDSQDPTLHTVSQPSYSVSGGPRPSLHSVTVRTWKAHEVSQAGTALVSDDAAAPLPADEHAPAASMRQIVAPRAPRTPVPNMSHLLAAMSTGRGEWLREIDAADEVPAGHAGSAARARRRR